MPKSMTTGERQHPINPQKKVFQGTHRTLICISILITAILQPPLYGESKKNVIEKSGKRIIDGKEYELTWSDEFNGAKLDEAEWRPRILGYYAGQYLTTKNAFLDGKGNLVLAMCALSKSEVLEAATTEDEKIAVSKLANDAWIPSAPHIVTKNPFLYGYFELRFKLPLVPGPGLEFWFPGNDDKSTEIDVMEQTLYNKGVLVDYKSSTIHWYPGGYNNEHRQYLSHQLERPNKVKTEAEGVTNKMILGKSKQLYDPASPTIKDLSTNGLIRIAHILNDDHFFWDDGKYHKVALLWTPAKYVFYYDDEMVCTYTNGISHVPEWAILSLRNDDPPETISKSKGRNIPQETPARLLIDYLRVYNTTSKQ